MRMFTCLSKNVSIALEASQNQSEKKPWNKLNFRTKKRRSIATTSGGTPKRPATSGVGILVSKKRGNTAVIQDNVTPRNVRFGDENVPPPFSNNYVTETNKYATKCRRNPPSMPLPAIPDDLGASVYIKELNGSGDEDNSDYLPLCHVEPPLTEEEASMTSSPSPVLSNHYFSTSTTYSSIATTPSASQQMMDSSSSPISQNVYHQINDNEVNNKISTAKVSTVKSVGSFNEAFIQSSASLPRLRNAMSSTRLDAFDTNACTTALDDERRVQTQPRNSKRSAMVSEGMTYSRRRAQQEQARKQLHNTRRMRQRTDEYCNNQVTCNSSNNSSSSSVVEEVSDRLEESIAEYHSLIKPRQPHPPTRTPSTISSAPPRPSRQSNTIEVFASNGEDGTFYENPSQVESQMIDVENCTQKSDTHLYSQLVNYSRSTCPSGGEQTETHESRIYYENVPRPQRVCEGMSQTSLVIPSGTSRSHPQGNTTVTSTRTTSNNYTAQNLVSMDYNSEEENNNYRTYECASQSSLSYSFSSQTDVSACDGPRPAYVNIERSCSHNKLTASLEDVSNNDNSCDSRASEFLGCMSFGVPHLLKKDLDGWYYLLTEEVGRKKHLQARGTTMKKPVLTSRGPPNVPIPNYIVEGQEKIVITVPRGKNGYGFSFVDELPPKVGRVDRASPAEQAGVKKGDALVSINGKNVSRSTSKGVAHLVKQTKAKSLTLELLRDHVLPTTTTASTTTSTYHPHPYHNHQQPPMTLTRTVGTSNNDDHLYESINDQQSPTASFGGNRDQHKENRRMRWQEEDTAQMDDDFLTDESQNYTQYGPGHKRTVPNLKALTSTPMPAAPVFHKPTSGPVARDRQESVHRLMSVELDFIDFMHYGTERYSRPLRHCIISAQQHGIMFQNVEKLVTISEYHIKQMQENAPSVNSEDTDDSQSSESSMFPNSVALIYQSKIHMLCQAYESYAHGLLHSNTLLREFRSNKDFMNFIKDTSSGTEGGSMFGHPSISAFINRPVQHIHELYTVFSEIFSATGRHTPDYPVLQKITCKLAQCITAITSLSSAGRVYSLDSLTSSQGCSTSQTTSSGKGSMASLTSCSSAETEALRTMRPLPSTAGRSIDPEVARIQTRLVFPPHIPTFQLCHEDRHIIFQGDIYHCHQGSWFKSHLLLLSDLLLLLDQEPNGSLRVVDTPFYLSDLSGLEVNRKHASEFILHLHSNNFYAVPRSSKHHGGPANTKQLLLRAPSSQEKFMWKSLLEQRVSSVSGVRLQHYGSMRDISNVKTSVVL